MGKKNTIGADFEILFHPDFDLEIKELRLVYSLDYGKTWDDYFANKLAPKKYNLSMYDLPVDQQMEFYLELTLNDGRVEKVLKDGNNYKVTIVDKGEGLYKAQIRIKDTIFSHRVCIICGALIKEKGIQCPTPECEATYCPICNRMLPPHSNYCPWDQKQIS